MAGSAVLCLWQFDVDQQMPERADQVMVRLKTLVDHDDTQRDYAYGRAGGSPDTLLVRSADR